MIMAPILQMKKEMKVKVQELVPVFVVEKQDIGLLSVSSSPKERSNDIQSPAKKVGHSANFVRGVKGEVTSYWGNLLLTPYLRECAELGITFPFIRVPELKETYCNYVDPAMSQSVDEKWLSWLEKGIIEPGETLLVMALGTVPKKNGQVRVIHDCRPLNRYVYDMPFSMDGLKEVAKFIKANDWLTSVDLKDGYEHVPIHIDFRKYFGVNWNGQTMRFAKLGFGFKLSPVLFQALMDSVALEASRRIGYKSVFVYLDDFLIRGSSKLDCLNNTNILLKVLNQLVLKPNWSKCLLEPQQSIEYLGKVWNSKLGIVTNDESHNDRIKSKCSKLIKSKTATVNELESFLGVLEWSARTMSLSRCWKRFLQIDLQNWKTLQDRGVDGGRLGGIGVFNYNNDCLGNAKWQVNAKRQKDAKWQLSLKSVKELKWWRDHCDDWIPF